MTGSSAKPTFVLFRFPNASNQANGIGEYVGSLVVSTPGGQTVYSIDADVVDYQKPDGTAGKYFRGRVTGGQEVVRSMLRGARIAKGTAPPDLVTLMDAQPFDDPLPEGMGCGGPSDTAPAETAEAASSPRQKDLV